MHLQQALKEDVVRSLMVRQAMLIDEMVAESKSSQNSGSKQHLSLTVMLLPLLSFTAASSTSSPSIVRFPRRVAVDLAAGFLLSDYCFQEEPNEVWLLFTCKLCPVRI